MSQPSRIRMRKKAINTFNAQYSLGVIVLKFLCYVFKYEEKRSCS